MILGLPPLPLTLTLEHHRALDIWLQACIHRIEREGRMSSLEGVEARGRVNGAKMMAGMLSETLTPRVPSVESSQEEGT